LILRGCNALQCFFVYQAHLQGEATISKTWLTFSFPAFPSRISSKYHSVFQAVPRGLFFVQHLAAIGHVSSKRALHASPYISTTSASYVLTRTSDPIKDREKHGRQKLEVKIKLVTRFEFAAKSEHGSHERRNALAPIENIQNELASRTPCP